MCKIYVRITQHSGTKSIGNFIVSLFFLTVPCDAILQKKVLFNKPEDPSQRPRMPLLASKFKSLPNTVWITEAYWCQVVNFFFFKIPTFKLEFLLFPTLIAEFRTLKLIFLTFKLKFPTLNKKNSNSKLNVILIFKTRGCRKVRLERSSLRDH